jgi:LuxR family transcriptional regulator, regulator of acetate metabolism
MDDGRAAAGSTIDPTILDQLADVISECAEEALRARLLGVHQALGGRLDEQAPPRTAARLSRRELDVLRLVAVGASNMEIAVELRLSPETVKSYLRTAMRRLDSHNRTGAVHAAKRSGLL